MNIVSDIYPPFTLLHGLACIVLTLYCFNIMSEGYFTSLSHPRRPLGFSAQHHVVLFCANEPSNFNFQIISYTFQPCLPGMAPRVTISYDCLVHLYWPCVWIHTLKMTVPTKTPTSQCIFIDSIDFLVHQMISCL